MFVIPKITIEGVNIRNKSFLGPLIVLNWKWSLFPETSSVTQRFCFTYISEMEPLTPMHQCSRVVSE